MISAKVRADSFAAALDPVQAWTLYDHHYQVSKGKWELTAAWAEKEFELSRRPSRSAFYEWLGAMKELEGAHVREIRNLCDERIEEKAKLLRVQDETVIRSIKAEALDAGLVEKDWDKAEQIMNLAHGIEVAAFKQAEIDLKSRADVRKDEELKLAREKFEAAEKRLNAAKDTVSDVKLTPEEKIRELDKLFGR